MNATIRTALSAAAEVCTMLELARPPQAEFWRRLAGAIRKGITKI